MFDKLKLNLYNKFMNCLYFHNSFSKKRNIIKNKDYILSTLSKKFDRVDCLENSDFKGLEEKLKQKDYDVLVFSGGDGTVNNVSNVVLKLEKPPILGYLPNGTANDFAKSTGIPKNIKKALNVILNGNMKKVDVFKENNRFGVYVCGTGIFTSSSYGADQEKKKKHGKLAYYFYSFKDIFSAKSFKYQLNFDGAEKNFNSVLTILVNSKSVAGYKFNKKAILNDGEMEFISINQKKDKLSFKSLCLIFRMFLFGIKSVLKSKSVTHFKFKNLKIDFVEPQNINIDGENDGKHNIDIEVLKEKLTVFVK